MTALVPPARTASPWPWILAFIRLPLVLLGSGIAVLACRSAGRPVGAAAGLGWSTLTLTVANLVCLGLLLWRSRVEGFDLWALIGFRRRLLARDLAWGLAWSFLLGVLLLAGVFGVVFLLAGLQGRLDFAAAFAGGSDFSFTLPAWLALVSAVVFPLLNPLVEELQYRGYAQPRLAAATGSARAGLLAAAAGFGLQHVVFALTPQAALAYAAGFFLWGLGAGAIARRQGRLVPLIAAHFVSNLSFGIIPLFFIAR